MTVTDHSLNKLLRGIPIWRWIAAIFVIILMAGIALTLLWPEEIAGLKKKISVQLWGDQDFLRIVVVLPPPPFDDDFIDGARMAVDELNLDGGIDGLPVKIELVAEEVFSDKVELERLVADTLALSSKVARQDNLLAVMGHHWSATAVPASSVYNRHKVLYLSTHATAPSLTNHGFDYVFALQPTSADGAAIMAHYAVRQGLKKFIVLSDDTNQGKDSAGFFRSWLTKNGGDVLYDGSLSNNRRSIDRLLTFILDNKVFKPSEIDGFFVNSSSESNISQFIKRARELGLSMPVLGTGGILSGHIEAYVGKENMSGVTGVSLYDLGSKTEKAEKFTQRFKKLYNVEAAPMAAVGYDAVKLLKYAATQAGSHKASDLIDRLRIMRYENPFVGVTGSMGFDVRGLITNTDVYVVKHDGTSFKTVDKYRQPLNWDILRQNEEASHSPDLKKDEYQ
ncbi:MAG: ABC transporter substrate-binding protein [Halopseudomonas aestusnigri]